MHDTTSMITYDKWVQTLETTFSLTNSTRRFSRRNMKESFSFESLAHNHSLKCMECKRRSVENSKSTSDWNQPFQIAQFEIFCFICIAMYEFSFISVSGAEMDMLVQNGGINTDKLCTKYYPTFKLIMNAPQAVAITHTRSHVSSSTLKSAIAACNMTNYFARLTTVALLALFHSFNVCMRASARLLLSCCRISANDSNFVIESLHTSSK